MPAPRSPRTRRNRTSSAHDLLRVCATRLFCQHRAHRAKVLLIAMSDEYQRGRIRYIMSMAPKSYLRFTLPICLLACTAFAADYRFDATISRQVLENYLSRSITMEGLLNCRGDLDDNIRMLKHTGAKFIGRSLCLWGGEANLLRNLERAKQQLPKVHGADPEM